MGPDSAMFAALSAAAAASLPGKTEPPGPGGSAMFVPTTPVMPYDILTPSQAASYLQVSESVVIQEAEAGRLPGQKLGGQWRFLRLAITEWLRASSPAPKSLSSKERMLAAAGAWKDDPTVDGMVDEIYRERKANPVGGK